MESWILIALLFIVGVLFLTFCWIQRHPNDPYLGYLTMFFIVLGLLLVVYYTEEINSYKAMNKSISNEREVSLPELPPLNSLSEAQKHINNSMEVAKADYSSILKQDSDKAIIDAINHSIQGGKRLRSSLALDVASRSAVRSVDATETGLALEYLHGASLIIDDMPHFDNDDVRRGRASTHILYGAATSQMAATGLTALAMECLIRQGDQLRKSVKSLEELARINTTASKLMLLTSDTMGVKGLAGGQLAEYSLAKIDQKKASLEFLENIIKRKTGALFEAAVVAGWIIGTSTHPQPPDELENRLIREAANHYGMAFQIADDIGDEEKDIKGGNGHVNYCTVRGKSEAQYRLEQELKFCQEKLEMLGLWSPIWEDAHQAARMMTSD